MYLNKVFLYGNLTRDPELKSLPSGTKVTSFSIATNRVWKDQNGARQESTDFHNLVVFGKQAETIKQYLHKGSSLFVEGRIQTRSWDANGEKKYRTEIIVDSFQFGPKAGGGSFGGGASAASNGPAKNAAPATDEGLDTIEYPDEEINLEDIPF